MGVSPSASASCPACELDPLLTPVVALIGEAGWTPFVKTEEVEAGGKKITVFKGTGTYTDPFGGLGAQENFALIGALIPMEGSGPVVIKLAGPKEATLGLLDALKKLATSPFAK